MFKCLFSGLVFLLFAVNSQAELATKKVKHRHHHHVSTKVPPLAPPQITDNHIVCDISNATGIIENDTIVDYGKSTYNKRDCFLEATNFNSITGNNIQLQAQCGLKRITYVDGSTGNDGTYSLRVNVLLSASPKQCSATEATGSASLQSARYEDQRQCQREANNLAMQSNSVFSISAYCGPTMIKYADGQSRTDGTSTIYATLVINK